MNKLIIPIIAVLIIAAGIGTFVVLQNPAFTEPSPTQQKPPIVKLSGGAAQLISECADRDYITDTADYIIEGVVEKAEAGWNEQKSYINTHVDFSIEKYVKGKSFGDKLQLQVSGGCVGGICQSSSEDVTFKQGDHLRLYLHKTETEFWIVCAHSGVEQIYPIEEVIK